MIETKKGLLHMRQPLFLYEQAQESSSINIQNKSMCNKFFRKSEFFDRFMMHMLFESFGYTFDFENDCCTFG